MEFVRGVKNFERNNPRIENIFGNTLFKPTRVLDIILDESHPDYILFDTPSCIGTIRHSLLDQESIDSNKFARPLFPHFKSYPIKNEIVFLINAPTSEYVEPKEVATYYLPASLAIWNIPNLNALPNKRNLNDDPEKGTTSFTYNPLIRPLKPYEGDTMIEGRFGNSIRLGSSNFTKSGSNFIGLNPWSINQESNGQPITIIRNGQNFTTQQPGQDPINENINFDGSSIYLTSNQQLKITPPAFQQIESYTSNVQSLFRSSRRTASRSIPQSRSRNIIYGAPISPSSFKNSQNVLSADRILINAQQDSILLFSKKSTGIHSGGALYIDSGEVTILSSPEIYLGNNANEPLLKGNITGEFLKDMLDLITSLVNDLIVHYTLVSGAPGEITGPYSNNFELLKPIMVKADILKARIDTNSNGMKSTQNFTI
jgi:hypothetical protein